MELNRSSALVGATLVALLTLSGCSSSTTTKTTPGSSSNGSTDQTSQPAPEQPKGADGTRANPYPIGTTVEGKDWNVTINGITLDADSMIAAEYHYNSAPDDGHQYVLVNATLTYVGDDANGQMPAFVSIDFVTADGVTASSLGKFAVAPDEIDSMSTLYNGASATGNFVLHVPSANVADGVLAIRPGMMADKTFVAMK